MTEYKLIIEEQDDGQTEEKYAYILSEHGAAGWRVAQMAVSPVYTERGLVHADDTGYRHKIVFLLEREK